MAEPKIGTASDGQKMHYSVGAVIKRGDKYLLLDRMFPPFGFAGVGGHVDEGESDLIAAMAREINEESGLTLTDAKLLYEEEAVGNTCKRGVDVHYWYLYECETEGELVWNQKETKSINWYSVEEIKKLELEPIWEYWFKKIGII